jgi:hypothetical protein
MLFSFVVALGALAAQVSATPFVVEPSPTKATNYQKWAHAHWVWLKNDLGNQANETALIQGYNDNNIRVGALNIDSEWATQFNNFIVDTNKFPDFKGFIDEMHSMDVRVILWYASYKQQKKLYVSHMLNFLLTFPVLYRCFLLVFFPLMSWCT